MKYQELLTKIDAYYQKIGVPKWPAAPIVHEGFPGNFNLSFIEYELLKHNGNYIDLKEELIYTANQPCIRDNDFKFIENPNQDSSRYLLRFTISPVGGVYALKSRALKEKMAKKVIFDTINFLTKECGLDIKKIYIQYLKPTTISEMTEGKYNFNYDIPLDPNLKYYQKLGIPKQNFIPVSNRDAFLALKVYGRPTPWGYRNEIFYKHHGKLLDIGTVEDLRFKPIIDKKGKICGLEENPHTFVLGGIGVERLLMVLNDFDDINQIDLISEPAAILRPYLDPQSANQFVQTLRAIQLIIADSGGYDTLCKMRKQRLRNFYKFLDSKFKNLVPDEIWLKVMAKIAQLEPNLPQLSHCLEQNLKEFKEYQLRVRYPHSWDKHLREQEIAVK